MHLDSLPLVASFTHPAAFSEHRTADRAPTSGVLDMNSAAPIRVRFPAMEFREELPHTGHRAKHPRLVLEIAGWPIEVRTAPRAQPGGSSASRRERLAGFPCISAQLGAELPVSCNRGSTSGAFVRANHAPSGDEVAVIGAVLRNSTITRMKSGTTVFACGFLLLSHINSITHCFEIGSDYCAIARRRMDEIDAQPSLFQSKPEQLTLCP